MIKKLNLDKLLPSPYNPKRPFNQKEMAALERSVQEFGFSSVLICCECWDNEGFYYVLDGNTRLELLKSIGVESADCKIIDIKDYKTLQKFVIVFDDTKKKYKVEEIADLIRTDDYFADLTEMTSTPFKIEIKESIGADLTGLEEIDRYMLALPAGSLTTIKKMVIRKAASDTHDMIVQKLDEANDDEFCSCLLSALYDIS